MRRTVLLLGIAGTIAVVALTAMLLPERGAEPVEANDPNVVFFMEIKNAFQVDSDAPCSTKGKLAKDKGDLVCIVPLKGTLNLSVELNAAGSATFNVSNWQAVVGWTTGLAGPGEPGPAKAFSIKNCTGIGATAAPFANVGPQTAAGACFAFIPPVFDGIEEFDIRFNVELTCGNDSSQELVTLIVDPAQKNQGTHILDSSAQEFGELQDKVITVVCGKRPAPGDSDGDGCPDQYENRPKADADMGGGRDWQDPFDFYDVAIAGGVKGHDSQIDLFNDIVGVIDHYAPTGTEPAYQSWYDRGPVDGPNDWNMTAPDGRIDLFNDIVGVINQFGHDCRT